MPILEQFQLTNQTAIVTGVNRGLGLSMAVALAEAGANIAGIHRGDCAEVEQLVEKTGSRFLSLQTDLADLTPESAQNLIGQTLDAFHSVDILVNNAGMIRRAPAVETLQSDWEAVLQVNLNALFYLSQAAAEQMIAQQKGKIINIASMLSFQGGILVPAYTASKSAVAGLTKALANEWAAQGVNVNAIAPGYMATDNTAPLRADEVRNQSILSRIPAGEWGKPSELAGITVFLASAASDYVNGAIIPVDGGWLAR